MDDLIYFLAAIVLVFLMYAGLDAWSTWGRDRWRALGAPGIRRSR